MKKVPSVILMMAVALAGFTAARTASAAQATFSITVTALEVSQIIAPVVGSTVGRNPTIYGNAQYPAASVSITGISGGTAKVVASTTSDINGKFAIRVDDATQLDTGSNVLLPYVNGFAGIPVNITVVTSPAQNAVPVIDPQLSNRHFAVPRPMIGGYGASGVQCTLYSKSIDGEIHLMGTADIAGSAAFSIVPAEDFTAGKCEIFAVANGAASDMVTIWFVDPYGIVYDSHTGEPVGGAQVLLQRSGDGGTTWNDAMPGTDILSTDLNPQTTGVSGEYEFMTVPGDFRLQVTKIGYTFPSSNVAMGLPAAGAHGEKFTVSNQILHIGLPVDFAGQGLLKIAKTANKKEANVGDIVTYTVTIDNDGSNSVTSVYVRDRIPGGFKYLRGKVRLNGAATGDPDGARELVFEIGTVAPGQRHVLSYQLVIGSGVTFGDYENRAVCIFSSGREISNQASASVRVVIDPTFDLGTILGKVFIDTNRNGVQDDGEKPLGAVRIIMEDGTVITTDTDGLYHVPGVMPGRHVLMVDERTLPKGTLFTTRKAVLVDVTNGMPVKANFGVAIDQAAIDAGLIQKPLMVTQDSQRPRPRLNVALYDMATSRERYEEGKRYVFRVFTNYAPFIATWRITIIDQDTKAVLREFNGTRTDIFTPVYWDGMLKDGRKVGEQKKIAYVLQVRSAGGAEDITKERSLELNTLEEDIANARDTIMAGERINSTKKSLVEWLSGESGGNNIEKQGINVDGETVHLAARDVGNAVVRVRDATGGIIELPANNTGSIEAKDKATAGGLLPARTGDVSTEVILPRGEYDIEVASIADGRYEPNVPIGSARQAGPDMSAASQNVTGGSLVAVAGARTLYSEHVKICEDYMTLVAMGDAKVGYAIQTGSLEAISDKDGYKTGLWHEGKLAYYLKGRIKGKYLVTSSLDTDRDKKELFRKIEPEKYYPVYGDASSVNFEATDTQGRLFLLVEWDKSSAIWGNYNTEFTDTELAQFNRTLYGGKVNYQSVEGTKFGEPVTKVAAFSSKVRQRSAHNEFMGTGGSLFYLKDRNVIQGSEKVTIEVRDKVTGLTIASKSMSSGSDYQMNYDHGRILFWRPVSMVAQSDVIISTALLDGNRIYVVVDYEYEIQETLSNDTSGVTGQQAISDHIAIGGTYVKEQQLDKDYELKAANAKIHLGDTAVLKAEYAESQAQGTGNWLSDDGGLTFTEAQVGQRDQGKAWSIGFEDHIADKFAARAYYKRIEDGFSSVGTTSQQGKELRGAEVTYDVTGKTRLKLSHDEQQLLAGGNPQTQLQVGAGETRTTIAQVTHAADDLKLTGEYRRQEVVGRIEPFTSETNQQGDIVAGRVDYTLDRQTVVSLEQQLALNGPANSQTTGSIVTRISESLDLRGRQTVGNKGSATSLGAVVRNKDRYELYTDYTASDYGMGSTASVGGRMKQNRNIDTYGAITVGSNGQAASVIGTRTRTDKGIEVVEERETASTQAEKKNTDIVGVSGALTQNWRVLTQMERGDVQKYDGSVVKRTADSIGIGYVETDKYTGRALLKTLTKLELRSDHGDKDERQYVLYNMVEARPDQDMTLSASLELSRTKDLDTGHSAARYGELVLGIAYRPIDWDSLAMLGKYTYLSDQAPAAQRGTSDVYDQKSHTISGEMIYDLTDKWQLVSKAAFKMGLEKVAGFDWTNAQKLLLAQRINYMFEKDWRIGLEYRRLSVLQAHDVRQGALIEVSRRIGDYLDFGIGYNFTDFNDDLTRLNYTSQGPYIRLTAILFN
jgi:uncharacterized repeat protein (TIGR01451 family)